MACYEYLREGEWLGFQYYTPEVVVALHKPDGSGQVNYKIEVDSGAAISLLPYSTSVLLGIKLTSGIPVILGGVGGSTFTCYVHLITMTMGDETFEGIPVAIAPTDDFPPLLGRLGLYDRADVFMDNTVKAACIGAVSEPLPPPGAVLLPADLGAMVIPIALVALIALVVIK